MTITVYGNYRRVNLQVTLECEPAIASGGVDPLRDMLQDSAAQAARKMDEATPASPAGTRQVFLKKEMPSDEVKMTMTVRGEVPSSTPIDTQNDVLQELIGTLSLE
ncbi:MAG TPA: hypothetical protein VFZ48_05265 [Candidatus Saccharimonadales bacterium]